jgi:predicted DNA-binding transcriptional regulator AlpA
MNLRDDQLLKIDEAAKVLSISPNTLRHWRWEGGGPKVCKIGRVIRYRMSDLESFLEQAAANGSTSNE